MSKKKVSLESLMSIIEEKQLSPKQLENLLKDKPMRYEEISLGLSDKHIKYLATADLHCGHKCYRPDILDHAAKMATKQGVDFILIAGDIMEGLSGRDGHIFELTHTGASSQIDYTVSELSKFKQPIYAITASNSHDGWLSGKNNMGLEVGPEFQRRLKNFNYLGQDEADIKLDNGLRIRMVHPGGGSAYAISYKLQKYVNAISGGQKPNIILEGHFHKSLYMLYRNIHCFEAGTMESQTNFMKKIGTPAMLGYWIVDVQVGKNGGVNAITPTFYPFYEKR